MTNAPAWLTYVAAGTSILSLAVSTATYRRAGPRVRAYASTNHDSKDTIHEDVDIRVTVQNFGLAAVDITRISLAFSYLPLLQKQIMFHFHNSDIYDGESLPFRIDPGSQKSWTFSLNEPLKRLIGERVNAIRADGRRLPPAFPGILWLLGLLIPVVVAIDLGNGAQAQTGVKYKMSRLINRIMGLIKATP